MTECSYARASDINHQPAVNMEKMTFSKKVREMGLGDLIVIHGRPCKIEDWFSGGYDRILSLPMSFSGVDIFTGDKRQRGFNPDHDCEVPHVSFADYRCTGIASEEDDTVILVSDRGVTRDDIKLPLDRFLRKMIRIGLKIGNKVFVNVVSSMGKEHIRSVTYAR